MKSPLAITFALFLGAQVRAADAPTAPAITPQLAFKVGFAERDITPDIGMEEPGGYGKVYHRTFHDPCKVRAVVFDDGRQRVALVGIDLLFITRALTKEARAEVEQRCGLKAGNILIGASHSHSSGPIGMAEPGDFDQASPLVRDLYFNKSTVSSPGYTQWLKRQIVEAVVAADAARV
ncbi:MAG TPA: hypothetical protein DCE44_02890, partial [Verrucomicrobiales bacterium]|nr:hypothetical protein [Verrucomicrobiales bacterium]